MSNIKELITEDKNYEDQSADMGLTRLLDLDVANIRRRVSDIRLVWRVAETARARSYEVLDGLLGCKSWWNHYFDPNSRSKDRLEANTYDNLSQLWRGRRISAVLGYEVVDASCSIVTLLVEEREPLEQPNCLGKVSFVIFGDFPGQCFLAGFFDQHHYESERYRRTDSVNIHLSLFSQSPFSVAKVRWQKLLTRLCSKTGEEFDVDEYDTSFTLEVSFPDMPILSGKDLALNIEPSVTLS